MKKRFLTVLTVMALCTVQLTGCSAAAPVAPAEQTADKTGEQAQEASQETVTTGNAAANVFANGLFEITIPEDLVGIAEVKVDTDTISVYHKASADAGFGGFVFSIWAAEGNDEFAGGPYEKIGELKNDKGDLYDVVRGFATEIQWDYEAPEMPADFEKIDEATDGIIKSIKGLNGLEYIAGAGMKGEDLYGDVLANFVTAVEEGWDATKLEEKEMSPEYYALSQEADGNTMDRIGFAYQDINHDGIDELLVGAIEEGEFKGVVYDVYTIVDHAPAHVVSGTARNRYYDFGDDFLIREWSGGAAESGYDLYALMSNSTELIYQYGYKYDSYENEEKPWFSSYDGETYESVTEEEYNTRTDMNEIVRFDYTPLSQAKNTVASADQTQSDDKGKTTLPAYEYPGPELFYTVLYKYIIDEFAPNYDKADVGIPCPIIIAEDESNKDDIKVWGDFWYFNYDLKGDTLENVSGGSYPGLIHIKSTDAGYEVTGMDLVGDGSEFDPTAKKIFGKYYDAFIKSNADTEGRDKTRAQIIANYVAANNLSIKAFQDYGWDPVPLPEENIDNFYSILD